MTEDQVSDLILGWLSRVEPFDLETLAGHEVIPYGQVYVVLAKKKAGRPEYVGWFAVTDHELNNPQFDFCERQGGKWLYRAKHDRA